MKLNKRKPRNEILPVDVPDDIATELNSILEAHPFSRSRLGLLALQIALPQLNSEDTQFVTPVVVPVP